MDILSFTLTATGAFGAGLTVGALVFSPRLVTRTDLAVQAPPAAPPAVVYAVPAAPAGPVLPPGYVMIHAGTIGPDNARDQIGVRSITSPDAREVDQ